MMTVLMPVWLQAAAGNPLREFLLKNILNGLVPEAWLPLVANILTWSLTCGLIMAIVQVTMLYCTLLERKFVGRIQDRIGPNRVGYLGLLQPFADMVKMLTKEDITPTVAHRWVYNLGAILVVPPAIMVFAILPMGLGLVASDLSVGFLYFVSVASVTIVPIFMAGWGSRNKYALLGAMRAVAQTVSYEIPQVLSVVGVLLLAGSLSTGDIVRAQGTVGSGADAAQGFPGGWFILVQPIAFVIYLLATIAEVERTPFDIPEADSEIIAGYHTEYAGIKFGLFQLSQYFMTIASSALGAVLFLGGWMSPFPGGLLQKLGPIDIGPFWMGAKTLLLILVFMWLRGTWPRLRSDQLMGFAWKVLVPLSLANLLMTALLGWLLHGWWSASGAQGLGRSAVVVVAFLAANGLLLFAATLGFGRLRAKGGRPDIRFEGAGLDPSMKGAA